MAIRESLNANSTTLGEVLSNGRQYTIPLFQREYAWEEKEWGELWDDIMSLLRLGDDAGHFLGALVLQPAPEANTHSSQIIDGQQRLVTLSTLILAAIYWIERIPGVSEEERNNNKERARLLKERFISAKDPASLRYRSRLRLNGSVDSFFQTYLVQGQEPRFRKKLKGAERRLCDCWDFFKKKFEESISILPSGEAIASFIEAVLANQIRFIEIRVVNDETSFSVFETLNARGVALSTADLLKNYIFAKASVGGEGDLEIARLGWERLVQRVSGENISSLLFHKISSKVGHLNERRVFSEVKRLVPRPNYSVFSFLQDLEAAAEVYTALDDPSDDLWSDSPPARRAVAVLSMLQSEQYKPVALAAFDRLSERQERLARLLSLLSVIAVRVSIAKSNTGDLQRAYQAVAYRIDQGELRSPAAIVRALKDIVPSDDEFQTAFEVFEINPKGRRRRFLRYLLSELEAASGGKHIDFDAADATVEHILPENPGPGWEHFSPEEHAKACIRLGNLTPLERQKNIPLGASSFEKKILTYKTSAFLLTSAIRGDEWTMDSLRARQKELARLAVSVWRLPEDD